MLVISGDFGVDRTSAAVYLFEHLLPTFEDGWEKGSVSSVIDYKHRKCNLLDNRG